MEERCLDATATTGPVAHGGCCLGCVLNLGIVEFVAA